jgi:hypothetical protein
MQKRLAVFLESPLAAPLLLLVIAILAYGLLLPQLGFYWDEVPMSWIRYELGPEAMTRYFSTNRPIWGLLYQLTTRLLPQVPLDWQVFGLFWRWVTALLVWAIMRDLWPGRRSLALIVSLCFLLYPGFNQQWTSYLYSHFFIVLTFFLFSILSMLWSFRLPRWLPKAWPLTILAMLFSGLNLWMMEYFFTLELFRPFVILYFVFSFEGLQSLWPRLRRTVTLWAPYLIVFLADVYWRLFVFNNQIYQPTLLTKLRAAPFTAFGQLLKTVLFDVYIVSIAALGQIFQFPNPSFAGLRTTILYGIVVLLTGALVAFFLLVRDRDAASVPQYKFWLTSLGLVAMLMAGGPFWLTGLEVGLAHPANRFTLPFMLGASLLFGGLIELIPARFRVGVAALLIALAAGRQSLWADDYRRDWVTQKTLFWQMSWRAPGIAPKTILLLNEGAFQFYADNSLTGALNWIYDPDNRSNAMDYVLFFPKSRLGGSLPAFEPDQPVTYNFISEIFTGNTSQTLAFYYRPPGCLRVLDPEIDPENHLIPDESLMREAARLSSSAWITPDSTARMPDVYDPEPAHGWCYYFEQADLARQLGDWQRVVQLGEVAFNLNDHPNDPLERFVFIEGYAHEGRWPRAEQLAIQSHKVSPSYVDPLLCRLLNRMDREISTSEAKLSSLNDLRAKFSCLP